MTNLTADQLIKWMRIQLTRQRNAADNELSIRIGEDSMVTLVAAYDAQAARIRELETMLKAIDGHVGRLVARQVG